MLSKERNNKKLRFLYAALMAFALLPLAALSFYALTVAQARYFPIVSEFNVTDKVYHENGDVTLSGNFVKNYEDTVCVFQGLKWYVVNDNGTMDRLMYKFGDVMDTKIENNRPKGFQKFYNWLLVLGPRPYATKARAHAFHTCLGFIPTFTVMGDVNVERQLKDDPNVFEKRLY